MKGIPQSAQFVSLALVWLILAPGLRATTSLQLGLSSGPASSALSVPLDIQSSDGVTAIQFDILYDPSVVELSSVLSGDASAHHTLDFEAIAEGLTRVVIVSRNNRILADGTLASLGLNLLQTVPEGSRSVSFSNLILSDTGGTEVAVSWAPYVMLTSPVAGSRYAQGSNVGISAIAIDYDGSIVSVEFFADGGSISMDSTAPYTATWTATGSGQVILTAVAVSSSGLQSLSEELSVKIGPAPFGTWLAAHFTPEELANGLISGITADPDIDLIPNLMEYALGLDPKNIDLDGIPEIGLVEVGL